MHYLHCSNCISVPSDSLCNPGEVLIEAKCQCERELIHEASSDMYIATHTHPPIAVESINQSINPSISFSPMQERPEDLL